MFTAKTDSRNDVECPLCKSTFSIANKGKHDLEQHLNSEKRKKTIRASSSSGKVSSFYEPKFSKLSQQIAAAEGTRAFHTVRHHFSFRSCDCSHKLLKFIIPDSKIAKSISSARTKTEAIVVNVLAPLSVEMVMEELKTVDFISISTDASNHGDKKLFPVLIQYYSKELGIVVKLIKINALKNETSETVYDYITELLKKYNLLEKVVAFSGDNCNTNFGGLNRSGKNFCYLDNPPTVIKLFFQNPLNECYLWFLHSIMHVFQIHIKKIEQEKMTVIEVLETINTIKRVLSEKELQQFLPLKVKDIFKKNDTEHNQITAMKKKLLNVYTRCIEYLNKWTRQFGEFDSFQWMSLGLVPTWDDFEKVLIYLKIKKISIDENKMFDQYCNFKDFVKSKIEDNNFKSMMSHEKWTEYFKTNNNIEQHSEIFTIASFFFRFLDIMPMLKEFFP